MAFQPQRTCITSETTKYYLAFLEIYVDVFDPSLLSGAPPTHRNGCPSVCSIGFGTFAQCAMLEVSIQLDTPLSLTRETTILSSHENVMLWRHKAGDGTGLYKGLKNPAQEFQYHQTLYYPKEDHIQDPTTDTNIITVELSVSYPP